MAQSNTAKDTSPAKSSSATQPVAEKVKNVLHESVEHLSQRAADTEEAIREAAQHGSENFSAKQAELEGRWEKSSIKRYAVENPVATAGIVFAAGMFFSTLLKQGK